jgi:hypothetical protein
MTEESIALRLTFYVSHQERGQVILRHTELTAYRCFLPDLAGFTGFCRTGPSPFVFFTYGIRPRLKTLVVLIRPQSIRYSVKERACHTKCGMADQPSTWRDLATICHGKWWRRGWDSNPRSSCPDACFPSMSIRPLSHLSAARPFERGGILTWALLTGKVNGGPSTAISQRIQLILHIMGTIESHPTSSMVWVDTWIHPTVQPQYNIAWVCGSRCRRETLRRCSLVREWRNWQTRET